MPQRDDERKPGTYDELTDAHRRAEQRREQEDQQRQKSGDLADQDITLIRQRTAEAIERSEIARAQDEAEFREQSGRVSDLREQEPQAQPSPEPEPHRPPSRTEAERSRMQAQYDRSQREAEAKEGRSDARADYMREHHPEEHLAEERAKHEQESRKTTERQATEQGSAGHQGNRDEVFETPHDVAGGEGVFHLTPERQQEAEQARDAVARGEQQRAAEYWDERQQDSGDGSGRDPRKETTARDQEMTERKREQMESAQRRGSLDWYLAKREFERERGDGGRDR